MNVTLKQIQEWAESPVTEALLSLVRGEIEDKRIYPGETIFPGDPQKTQELLVGLAATQDNWEIVVALLEGDWSYFVKEEDEDSE